MDPRVSLGAAFSIYLSLSLYLLFLSVHPFSYSLSLSLPMEGGGRMNKLALQREFAALVSADPNLRYLLYGTEEKRVSTATNALHTAPRNCHVNCAQRYFSRQNANRAFLGLELNANGDDGFVYV